MKLSFKKSIVLIIFAAVLIQPVHIYTQNCGKFSEASAFLYQYHRETDRKQPGFSF